jgi:dihydropteroate synthase
VSKVLVQLNSLALGGSQINAVDLAAATAEHGYDCVLVGPKSSRPDGPSLVDAAEERGVRLETFERAMTPRGLATCSGACGT